MNYQDLSILIVDNNESLRGQIVEYFSQRGVNHIRVSRSFADARKQIYKKPQLDLILFDIEIMHNSGQVEDGLDFLDEIKRSKVLPLRTAFVVLSGESHYSKIYDTLKHGVDAYLLKPISVANLGLKIDEVLKKRNSIKQIYNELERGHIDTAMVLAKDAYLSRRHQAAGKIVYELLMMEDKAEEARAFLTTADHQQHPWAILELAKLDIKLGALQKGLTRLKNLTEQYPNQPEILEILYYGLWEVAEFNQAHAVLENAVSVHPYNAARLQLLGLLDFKLGKANAQSTMLRAFNLTKVSRILNFSLLVCLFLSGLKENPKSLDPVIKFFDKGLEGSEGSLRVSLITQLLTFLKTVLSKKPQEEIEAEANKLIEHINTVIFDKRLDWDTAFSCLQVFSRVPVFRQHSLMPEILNKITKRYGTTAGFLNSIKLELSQSLDWLAVVDGAMNEFNEELMGAVSIIPEGKTKEGLEKVFLIADIYVNARALNLGIGLLQKNKGILSETAQEELCNKFLNLKVSGYFSGNNLFTSNKWFMNGRY